MENRYKGCSFVFEEMEKYCYSLTKEYEKMIRLRSSLLLNDAEKELYFWFLTFEDGVNMADARRVLDSGRSRSLSYAIRQYIEFNEKHVVNPLWNGKLKNCLKKNHFSSLDGMKLSMQQIVERFFCFYKQKVMTLLIDTYEFHYKKTSSILGGSGEVEVLPFFSDDKKKGTSYSCVKGFETENCGAVLELPWAIDGKNVIDRMNKNRNDFLKKVFCELNHCIIRGDGIEEIYLLFHKQWLVFENQCIRLLFTEMSGAASRAKGDCYREYKVSQYKVVASLDSNSSDICKKMNGKVFDVKKYVTGITAPPFHCWCKSYTIPVDRKEV